MKKKEKKIISNFKVSLAKCIIDLRKLRLRIGDNKPI